MAQRRNDSHRPVRRPPPSGRNAQPHSRAMFDQDLSPVPHRREPRSGMQQVILPVGQQPSAHPRSHESQKARKRRVTRGEMRRRRMRRRLLACAGLLLLVTLGVILSVTVLFKVSGYRVEGMDHSVPADTGIYSEDAILSALGISTGENLFDFSLKEKEKEMALALPYLESIQLRRSLPGTIVVRVEPAVESYKLSSPGGWVVVSKGLKVLKVQPEEPDNLLYIEGVEPLHPAGGMPLVLDQPVTPQSAVSVPESQSAQSELPELDDSTAASSESSDQPDTEPVLHTLHLLLEQMQTDDLINGVNSINLSDLGEISFLYENRVRVRLGSVNALDYKMEWARYILLNQKGDGLQPGDRGRLDISHVRPDGSIQPLFTPGAAEEQAAPQPAAASTEQSGSAPESGAEPQTEPNAEPQPSTEE